MRTVTVSTGPASASNGADVRALLDGAAVDAAFAADVLAARDAVTLEGPASLPD